MAHYTRAWVRSGHLCMSQEVTSKRSLYPHTSVTVRATGCLTSYQRHLRICQAFPSTNRIPKFQTKCLAKGLFRKFIKKMICYPRKLRISLLEEPTRPQPDPCRLPASRQTLAAMETGCPVLRRKQRQSSNRGSPGSSPRPSLDPASLSVCRKY